MYLEIEAQIVSSNQSKDDEERVGGRKRGVKMEA